MNDIDKTRDETKPKTLSNDYIRLSDQRNKTLENRKTNEHHLCSQQAHFRSDNQAKANI